MFFLGLILGVVLGIAGMFALFVWGTDRAAEGEPEE